MWSVTKKLYSIHKIRSQKNSTKNTWYKNIIRKSKQKYYSTLVQFLIYTYSYNIAQSGIDFSKVLVYYSSISLRSKGLRSGDCGSVFIIFGQLYNNQSTDRTTFGIIVLIEFKYIWRFQFFCRRSIYYRWSMIPSVNA